MEHTLLMLWQRRVFFYLIFHVCDVENSRWKVQNIFRSFGSVVRKNHNHNFPAWLYMDILWFPSHIRTFSFKNIIVIVCTTGWHKLKASFVDMKYVNLPVYIVVMQSIINNHLQTSGLQTVLWLSHNMHFIYFMSET